jgi:hypothetical protein
LSRRKIQMRAFRVYPMVASALIVQLMRGKCSMRTLAREAGAATRRIRAPLEFQASTARRTAHAWSVAAL